MLKFATASLLVAFLTPSVDSFNGPFDISPDGLNEWWEPGDYGVETCGLQKEIVDFSVRRLSNGECGGTCQTYEICLTLHLERSSIISGFPGKTSLNMVCVKDAKLCTPKSFSDYLNKIWATDKVGLAKGGEVKMPPDEPTTSGSTQCQTVPAGQTAEFELSDGLCLPPDSTWADEAYVGLLVSNEPVSLVAECHSRPGWYQRLLAQGVNPADLGSCTCLECLLPKNQCIWRIQAPPCASPSPSPAESSISTPLVTAMHDVAGQVEVSWNGTHLQGLFNCAAGWDITSAELCVSLAPWDKKPNPNSCRTADRLPNANTFLINSLPMDYSLDLSKCTDGVLPVYIAAHAEYRSPKSGSQPIWGNGTNVGQRGDWASYFQFNIYCSIGSNLPAARRQDTRSSEVFPVAQQGHTTHLLLNLMMYMTFIAGACFALATVLQHRAAEHLQHNNNFLVVTCD